MVFERMFLCGFVRADGVGLIMAKNENEGAAAAVKRDGRSARKGKKRSGKCFGRGVVWMSNSGGAMDAVTSLKKADGTAFADQRDVYSKGLVQRVGLTMARALSSVHGSPYGPGASDPLKAKRLACAAAVFVEGGGVDGKQARDVFFKALFKARVGVLLTHSWRRETAFWGALATQAQGGEKARADRLLAALVDESWKGEGGAEHSVEFFRLCVGVKGGFGCPELFGMLVGLGLRPSAGHLLSACKNGNPNVVRECLQAGLSPDSQSESDAVSPMLVALSFGWPDAARELLKAGFDIRKNPSLIGSERLNLIASGRLEGEAESLAKENETVGIAADLVAAAMDVSVEEKRGSAMGRARGL